VKRPYKRILQLHSGYRFWFNTNPHTQHTPNLSWS